VTYAQRALALVPLDDHLNRGAAAAILGLVAWTRGDLEVAYRSYAEGMAHLDRIGNVADTIAGAITLADLRIAQGRLHEAVRTYERGLQRATDHGAAVLRGAADMHVGLSEICRERNDLDAARHHLLRSTELGEHLGFPQHPYRRRVALARIQQVEGNLPAALELLDEAERRYMSDFSPNVRPIAAQRTRVWIAQGRLGEARDWARERGLAVGDALSYLHEFEHITLVRLLLASSTSAGPAHSLHPVLELLRRLLAAAQQGARTGSVVEILVVQALAHQAQGDLSAALVALQHALTLAKPEGYVRLFVDEGPPMAALLIVAVKRGIEPVYVRRLLAAFPTTADRAPITQGLCEPLSDREREVLRLLGTYLSGPDIARELTVSLNTLRTHTKNIYEKLGVNNRQAAVRRAQELELA
jgi:LuxR family transcriptional regulator, maltose regulon positive regulatory protein